MIGIGQNVWQVYNYDKRNTELFNLNTELYLIQGMIT